MIIEMTGGGNGERVQKRISGSQNIDFIVY
jgi:hypothetical protein